MTLEHLRELAPRTYDYLRSLIGNGSLPVHASTSSNQIKEAQNGWSR
jgi:hypothetical protein